MYQIKKWRNNVGEKTLEDVLEFTSLQEAENYYRQYRISYGSGAVFFTLDPISEVAELSVHPSD